MAHDPRPLPIHPIHGRGATGNPDNRFVPLSIELDPEHASVEPGPTTRFFRDSTQKIISRNDSPDVGFEFSLNPYRGCEHGCIYCYARPTHEYLGLSAGLDFESKIFVKEDAPELLRRELSARSWKPATIALSGVTDPYQPVERKLGITRRCLEVLAEVRNPVSVITKNHLVTRDADILADMAGDGAAAVNLSVTTLDPVLQRRMEPRTSSPARRLAAIQELSRAGIPVGVMVAPVVPGLTDHELPAILQAVADAGARTAGFVVLRLPFAVSSLFEDWLKVHYPDRAAKVVSLLKGMRGGKLYDSRFGQRMRGEGPYALQIEALFQVTASRLGLNRQREPLSTAAWRFPRPIRVGGDSGASQLTLFQ